NDLRAVLDANTPTRAALHKIECPVQHEGSLGPPVLPVVEPAKARETHLPSTRVVRYSLSRENRADEQPGFDMHGVHASSFRADFDTKSRFMRGAGGLIGVLDRKCGAPR